MSDNSSNPEPADYSDELSFEQIAVLRTCAPQTEGDMGDLVHEFQIEGRMAREGLA